MSIQKNDIYNLDYFDEDEKKEIADFEESWKPGNKFSSEEESRIMTKLKVSALESRLKKDRKITFRLPNEDLIRLKAKARHNGMEYQPLLAALIHKYVANEIRIEL